MGEPTIGFGITKLRGANAVQPGHDIKPEMEQIKAQLPEGQRLDVNWDTTVFVERAINAILLTLLLAAILTGFVCWLFLGSWSTTVNILLAIPTSILGTFIVIYFFGFTLNTYTVLGLTPVFGIVVDDAIMVLASQFNAFSHPFTILLALPFSISGALFALWIAGQSMNIYSMLGLILLVGIAKKNSIMLVDFTNQIRARGVDRHRALLQACPIRLRPILMTSVATIAGALPPAFAIGPGAELQRPMALALVGGMAVSTLLTLFVVPAAYSVLDDIIEWNKARRREGIGLVAALGRLRRAQPVTD